MFVTKVLNISNRAYVDTTVLRDCQFFTNEIIRPGGFHAVGIPLYTIVLDLIRE